MSQYRLDQLFASFSWWIPFVAILGLLIGVWLLRKYDFSYKINFKLLIVGIIVSVLLAGWAIDITGLNDFWAHRGQGLGQGQQLRGISTRILSGN
jgi:hypothetical protein